MEVDKHEFDIISKALREWEQTGVLQPEQVKELQEKLLLKRTERQQIAQYFFIIAVSCAVLAFGAIFIDDKILEKLKAYFELGNLVIAVISASVSVLWFWYVYRNRGGIQNNTYEVYTAFGGMLLLISLVYIFKDIGAGPYYVRLLSAAAFCMFAAGIFFTSRVLWLGSILILLAWFGAFTTWQGNDYLFLGINYPIRITIFGAIVFAISFLQNRIKKLSFSSRITYLSGLLIFLTGMWTVSIFGNYGHLDEWAQVRQSRVMVFALVSGVFSVIIFYLGIRLKDNITRDIAVLFLLLNLYTRYFEYFWDHTNKGLFFLLLAISFYAVGRWLNKRKQPGKPAIKTP